MSQIDHFHQDHTQSPLSLCFFLQEKIVASVSTDSKQREVGYLGKQIFELSNHLGNVLATITDKKLQVSTNTTSTAYFEADVQTVQDYYAFGMQMPGRKLSGGYRYGFNGKENDNEVKGEGNQQDYGLRIYDPRLGKFLSVDPLAKEYPWYTPYQFAGNTPIQAIDLDGGEPKVAGKNEAESGKDFVIAGSGPGGYGEIQRNWKWHSGGLTTSSGKKTQANWYSPDDYLTLLSKTNAAASTGDKLNLFSSAAKGWQKSSADAGQMELENFVGDGSNDNAASSILRAAQIRANNANTSVSGRADLSSVNVEDFIGVGLLLKQLVKQGIKIGIGEAAKGGVNAVEQVAVHGNSLKSLKPTWGYKLYSQDGTFLKNGITSAVKAESRYTKAFMSDKVMLEKKLFPNRAAAYQWEFQQNQIFRGPLNFNMH